MSRDVSWDVNKYKEEHESEDQWELRKAFLEKWKDQYPEERLVCLAQVFTNIEFMGCRYPKEVMHEIATLSIDIAKQYRNKKKTKLQRTFVSASDAAGDRARGVKREGGVVVDVPKKKSARIEFVPQSQNQTSESSIQDTDESCLDALVQRMKKSRQINIVTEIKKPVVSSNKNEKPRNAVMEPRKAVKEPRNDVEEPKNAVKEPKNAVKEPRNDVTELRNDVTEPRNDVIEINEDQDLKEIDYLKDMLEMKCLDPRDFNEQMYNTPFGKFVLVIRPWADIINNLSSSCGILKIPFTHGYKNGVFKIIIGNHVLASVPGDKAASKAKAGRIVWNILRHNTVMLLLKEQWIPQNDAYISSKDMSAKKYEFGEPIEDSVALKMMKLMGWKGGGLGADSQGIAEPIKPNLRMVRRAGLGHEAANGLHQLKRAGMALMRRRGVVLDADLVFAADFTPEERAVLHHCANSCGLNSRSYGKRQDRFLVVTNKLRPLSLVPAVVECGGETPKYRVFIPSNIDDPNAWTSLNLDRRWPPEQKVL